MAKVNFSRVKKEGLELHTFLWTIPNFLENLRISDGIREYRTVAMDDQRPQLRLQIWGHKKEVIDISVFSPISICISGALVIDPSRTNNAGKYDFLPIKGNSWYHLTSLLKRDITSSEIDYLDADEELKLEFIYKIFNFSPKRIEVDMNENTLSYNLRKTLEDGTFSDAVIKSKSGKEYRVHKALLASRSVVLKANFEHGTKECATHIIDSPFDSEVIEEVLSYIYSDHVSKMKQHAKELLAAADYYKLDGLKRLCEEELAKEFSVENAMELLEIADTHQADGLKRSVTDSIKRLKLLNQHLDSLAWKVQYCAYN